MTFDKNFETKLSEIHRLLMEAYNHYFSYENHSKAGEGIVSLHFPNYWEMRAGEREPSVEIYSYVLSDSRSNHFDNIDEALEAVKKWHKRQISYRIDQEADDFAENELYNTKFVKF